ncbi:hypothetical protein MRB53_038583 [Persea americana]|nr:hypothetical protein MRB53_038583 [Persea americana]
MIRTIFTTALFAASAFAQTLTDCQPLNGTCPADNALGTQYNVTFNKNTGTLDKSLFNVTAGTSLISFGDDGMQFKLSKSGDSVSVKTTFYIMFGTMEIVFKAAAGQGLISSGILLSDDLDEVDWEIMGGNTTHVSNNWFGQGIVDPHNSEYPAFDNAPGGFHSYKFDWDQDRIQYILDGKVVRTLPSAAPGKYPQTPSYVSMALWAGGDTDKNPPGTVDWAGGPTDWSKGPFTMTVKSITVNDKSANSSTYTYSDKSGSWQSIKTATGKSAAYNYINKVSGTQQTINNWNGLSQGAKIGIACGVIGVVVVLFSIFCVYCMMQRKKGRLERVAADKEWAAHEAELLQYRRQMGRGGFARMPEGNRI